MPGLRKVYPQIIGFADKLVLTERIILAIIIVINLSAIKKVFLNSERVLEWIFKVQNKSLMPTRAL